jgi:hypothetical protein
VTRHPRPITEKQLARYSAVPVKTVLYVCRHAPDATTAYWLASSLGELLSPEGSRRRLHRFEGGRSGGVLLSAERRRQLAWLERLWSPCLAPEAVEDALRYAVRAHQRRLAQLGDIGLLHRCTPKGPVTLYLERHEDGDPCEWNECPSGVFETRDASPGNARSVTARRLKRHDVTPETGQPAEEAESVARPAESTNALTSPGDASNRMQRRMKKGMQSPSPTEEEALENIDAFLGSGLEKSAAAIETKPR